MADNEFMDETMTRTASTQGWKQANKWSGKPSKKRQWLDRVKKDLKRNPELLLVFDEGFSGYNQGNFNRTRNKITTDAIVRKLIAREGAAGAAMAVMPGGKLAPKDIVVRIEEDAYAELPAPVYTRGFVTAYARTIGVDPQRVASSFMARFEDARGEQRRGSLFGRRESR